MNRKISCLIVALMIILSTINSFAAVTFSDVPSNHWAKPFITKMADKKIISGYFDDKTLKVTFKPDKNVTYIEAMQMIYNTLKGANKLRPTSGLANKYYATLTANKIPTWAHEAIAYGLEYNILHPDELKIFVKNGNATYAKKVDVSVFIGKALNMKLEAIPVLNFVDAETIKTAALPYVDLLEKNKIVKGDAVNKFNPNSIINRAVMATMCSNTYDLLIKQSSTVIPSNPIVSTTLEGTIDYVSTDTKMIVIKDTKGDTKAYTLKSVYIKKNGQYIEMSALNKGDYVKLTFNSKGEVQGVEVNKTNTSSGGTDSVNSDERIIDYISEKTNMIVVKDGNGATQVYNLNGVNIRENGKSKDVDDLQKGDGVKLHFNDKNELAWIEISTSTTTWIGKIMSITDYDDYYLMTIRNKDNLILKKDLKIYDNTEIEYNKKSVTAKRLTEGEEVQVKFIGNRAIKVYLLGEEKVYDGILESSVIFREHPILKIATNNNEVLEFEIDEDVKIYRDRHRSGLDDLRKGDLATITVEYDKIVNIVAASREEKTKDEGAIKQIIIGDPTQITIETEDKKTHTYDVDDDVDIEINDDGDKKLSDLKINYQVELKIKDNVVKDIVAEGYADMNTISGEITKIYSDIDYFVVKYYDKDKEEYVTRTVAKGSNTKVYSTSQEKIAFGHLRKNDRVFISGNYNEDIFVANKIIQID
ncbi:S-layer homology domain-containing protein [Crassaminicella profunda]|uniref:S-layer homology domain-containing protein n=1 Tax=Crassaminicella profunda TaxID=1286698 RepID=UPI001CA60C91|nr:S-layer homology domain-containing protein [Crassaminicella profunda]QZY55493.1 S-layer homology domain-containing protein [Crassaminicella profunda]